MRRIVVDAIHRNARFGIEPQALPRVGIWIEARIVAARHVDRDLVTFIENEARRPEVDARPHDLAGLHEDFLVQTFPVAHANRGIQD